MAAAAQPQDHTHAGATTVAAGTDCGREVHAVRDRIAVLWDMDGTLLDTEGIADEAINTVLSRWFGLTVGQDILAPTLGLPNEGWGSYVLTHAGICIGDCGHRAMEEAEQSGAGLGERVALGELSGASKPGVCGCGRPRVSVHAFVEAVEAEKARIYEDAGVAFMPGAAECVGAFAAEGWLQGIGTSGASEITRTKLCARAAVPKADVKSEGSKVGDVLLPAMAAVVTRDMVNRGKPHPDIYCACLHAADALSGSPRSHTACTDDADAILAGSRAQTTPWANELAPAKVVASGARLIVVEDALSGVASGAAAGACVIAIPSAKMLVQAEVSVRADEPSADPSDAALKAWRHVEAQYLAAGSRVVLASLRDLNPQLIRHILDTPLSRALSWSLGLPDAVRTPTRQTILNAFVRAKMGAALFDYDGTLARNDVDPPLRIPTTGMLESIAVFRDHARVRAAIVTGRSFANLRGVLDTDGFYVAASHGYDIRGPRGEVLHTVAADAVPIIQAAKVRMRHLLDENEFHVVPVYDEGFFFSVHVYKLPGDNPGAALRVMELINACVSEHAAAKLRIVACKGVVEVRPAEAWHKEHASRWLLQHWTSGPGLRGDHHTVEHVPVLAVGDDLPDEDMFAAVVEVAKDCAHTIAVIHRGAPRPTTARYVVDDVAGVESFLAGMAAACKP